MGTIPSPTTHPAVLEIPGNNILRRSYRRRQFYAGRMLPTSRVIFSLPPLPTLCPNTTYEFSAWIVNVIQPLQQHLRPILPFILNNRMEPCWLSYEIGQYTGKPHPDWQQYGLIFTTPAE